MTAATLTAPSKSRRSRSARAPQTTANQPVSPKGIVTDGPKSAETAPEALDQDMGIFGIIDAETIAVGYMTPRGMDGLLYISRFEESDPDSTAPDNHGYQRNVNMARIPGIARYYANQRPAPRVPSLMLAVRVARQADVAKFMRLFNTGDKEGIIKQFGRACISVMDGQHRFLGLVEAHRQNSGFNPKVPVNLNFGLHFAEEAETFDVLNTTQKKLPPALLEVTKTDITEVGSQSHQQRLRNITKRLSRDEQSVWEGLINEPGERNPETKISFNGMRRALGSMFPVELLSRVDAAELDPEFIAMDYWKLISEVCATAWEGNEGKSYRIQEVAGVSALCKLGRDIIASALEHDNFDQRVAVLVGKLSEVDWEKSPDNPWMAQSQAGMAGQAALYQIVYDWVYTGKKPKGA